jgi:aryl-alcohol dehydrogenase-like predicted oxidoreductase
VERRRLGRTDVEVSQVGLGTVTFGREIGEAESFRLMDHARSLPPPSAQPLAPAVAADVAS